MTTGPRADDPSTATTGGAPAAAEQPLAATTGATTDQPISPPAPDGPAPDGPAPDGRLGRALDRISNAAQRRLTPRRALGILAAATVVTGTTLALVLMVPIPAHTSPQWTIPADLEVVNPPVWTHPAHQPFAAEPVPSPPPPPGAPPQPAGEFTGWAVVDRDTGAVTGSDSMTEVSTTASMIKAWIVADYLRRATEAGDRPSSQRLDQLTLIIRDSDNGLAESLFQELGRDSSIERLIGLCSLIDSRPYPNFWSNTQLSPRDTARMGACLADGRAAGPEWTDWLMDEMRAVRGVGDFGIRHAFSEDERADIAIKNGWINRTYDGNWHVNCLAIGDTWTMGIMLRYPLQLGVEHGFDRCRELAEEHLLPLLP